MRRGISVCIIAILSQCLIFAQGELLERFRPYILSDFGGEYFLGEHSGASDERGVRTNADLSMIAAWLGEDSIAYKSLRYALETHKANHLRPCSDGRYWGSISAADHVWESSLWTFSVAWSAYFQWNRLSPEDKSLLYRLLKAECNYELERDIPTGFRGDTKAEENGWETNVLAATLGLYPDDPLAPQWFERLREFAINCYSHPSDANDTTVIDPDYAHKTVADLYRGANLYPDYTLQNHGYFHTSYQNVVMQELGESALALEMFQAKTVRKPSSAPSTPLERNSSGEINLSSSQAEAHSVLHAPLNSPSTPLPKWHTNALMHNQQKVMDEVLKWLALPDGELAMPNGNDWSLFLYDQLTSYSTMACFLRDPDALMLEQQCLRQIEARQHTTSDGSWLLRPDVGARRMGVQAQRVLMTLLMHEQMPTTSLSPSTWGDFSQRYRGVKYFPEQKLIRLLSSKQFACFCWSDGLKNYTGYFAPISAVNNNIVVPFKHGGTGNLLGWYDVNDHHTNARAIGVPEVKIGKRGFTISGTLLLDDGTLSNQFTLKATKDKITYSDVITAEQDVELLKSTEGALALSYDPFTRTERNVLIHGTTATIDSLLCIDFGSSDINISKPHNNNSILTSIISTSPTAKGHYKKGQKLIKHKLKYKVL